MQTVLCHQKWGRDLRRPMSRPETGYENATLLACDRTRCFAKKVLASIAPYTFISHTKGVNLLPKGSVLGPLESQPGNLILETFS